MSKIWPFSVIAGRTSGNVNVPVLVDSNGKLVVDVAVTSGGSAIEDGVTAAIKATVRDYAASNPLAVVLTDTDGASYVASGGGGGSAVTIADGADVAEGAVADAKVTGDNNGTLSAKLRGLSTILADVWDSVGHTLKVATHAVTQSGTWTVQPGNTANTTAWKVDGSAVTQPVSAAALPLPTGASTAAKQPALGTAGTASADVITVQGIASMTALKVDGSGVTQPVSGTVTANAGTNLNTSALALEAGHIATVDTSTAAISAVAGTTAGAAVITDANGTIQQYLRGLVKLAITAGGFLVTAALATGSNIIGRVGIDQTTPGTTDSVSVATAQGAGAAIGATSGAAVITDANGTIQQYLRGLVKILITRGSAIINVAGGAATNVAIVDNPLNQGAQGVSSENAVVTTGRMVQLVADLVGKLIVLPYSNPENFVSFVSSSAMTGTTSTIALAAPASGLRNYITQITVSNSHATVGTDMLIQDGNGGTTLYRIPAAALYGGATLTFPAPLRQPTTATAIYVANVTTGASTVVSMSGYKGV